MVSSQWRSRHRDVPVPPSSQRPTQSVPPNLLRPMGVVHLPREHIPILGRCMGFHTSLRGQGRKRRGRHPGTKGERKANLPRTKCKAISGNSCPADNPSWYPDASINWAENMLRRRDDKVALVQASMCDVCSFPSFRVDIRHFFYLAEPTPEDPNPPYRKVTYGELYGLAARVVGALQKEGVQAGDRVGSYASNCIVCLCSLPSKAQFEGFFTGDDRRTSLRRLQPLLSERFGSVYRPTLELMPRFRGALLKGTLKWKTKQRSKDSSRFSRKYSLVWMRRHTTLKCTHIYPNSTRW